MQTPDAQTKDYVTASVFAPGFGGRFGDRSFFGHRRADLAPDEIDRNPNSYNQQTRPRLCRLINEQDQRDYRRADNIKSGDNRIAESLVWTIRAGLLPAKHKDSQDRKDIENQGRRNHIGQQIVVERTKAAVGIDGARQHQGGSPDALHDQAPGGNVLVIELARLSEEQAIARHGVVRARAGKNQSIIATERRDHDRDRHNRRATSGKNCINGSRSHSIGGNSFDCLDRQGNQRKRNIAFRILYLAGGEGDVVPRVSSEQGISLRDTNTDKQSKRNSRGQTASHVLQFAADMPEIAKIQMHGIGIPAQEHAQQNQSDQAAGLGNRENILHQLAEPQSARVHEGQQDDHQHADKLGRRQRDRVTGRDADGRHDVVIN